jgi:hypothetical protein
MFTSLRRRMARAKAKRNRAAYTVAEFKSWGAQSKLVRNPTERSDPQGRAS